MVKTYDPKQVALIFGGKILHGFADGSFVKIKRDEPTFTKKVGVDGEACRAKSNNKGGTIEVTLLQSSPSNDDLSAFAAADELTNTGVQPFLMKDGSGSTVCAAATAWIQKPADVEDAKEVGNRVWTIETDEIDMFVGGNNS